MEYWAPVIAFAIVAVMLGWPWELIARMRGRHER